VTVPIDQQQPVHLLQQRPQQQPQQALVLAAGTTHGCLMGDQQQ
jgi:hypothetical protein